MAEDLTLELANGCLRATFLGEPGLAPRAACDALVAEIERTKPRAVHILCDFASPGAGWTAALAGHQLPSVQSFVFDTFFQTQTRQRENAIGDLAATLAAVPAAELLFACGALELSPTEHALLRALHLLGDPLAPAVLDGLGASRFPALERLAVSLASDAEAPDAERAFAAIAGVTAPRLRYLELDIQRSAEDTLRELVDRELPRRGLTVALRGPIDDEDALLELVTEARDALARLDALVLPLADFISTDGAEQLHAILPAIQDASEVASGFLPAVYRA